jgi:hypothetical protein|tara:strand:+ start:1170 stop:1346 length:177 start_codon:yes stop_codon:yes gene_type:complete
MKNKENKYIVEYWYLTSWKEGECYDVSEVVVMAKNEKEALRKAPFYAHTRRAKDFKII